MSRMITLEWTDSTTLVESDIFNIAAGKLSASPPVFEACKKWVRENPRSSNFMTHTVLRLVNPTSGDPWACAKIGLNKWVSGYGIFDDVSLDDAIRTGNTIVDIHEPWPNKDDVSLAHLLISDIHDDVPITEQDLDIIAHLLETAYGAPESSSYYE